MSIFNKDGSVFKLGGVNPLMRLQDHWQNSVVRLHGFDSIKEVVLQDPMLTVDDRLDDDDPVQAIVGVGVIKDTTLLYCLPMIFIEIEDPVYGEKSRKPGYGEKFTFEAVLIEFTGFAATFFCNLPEDKVLLPGSIFFVLKERQWWKLEKSSKGDDGLYLQCFTSDVQPSFV